MNRRVFVMVFSCGYRQESCLTNMETNTMHLGQIIKETGDFGRFQIFMTVFMFPTMLVYNWSMMAMAYTATTPNWHCFAPAIGQNENGSLFEENVCSINGTSCDRITFSDDMRTAVSEVKY